MLTYSASVFKSVSVAGVCNKVQNFHPKTIKPVETCDSALKMWFHPAQSGYIDTSWSTRRQLLSIVINLFTTTAANPLVN